MDNRDLIPPPETIRAELARSVREAAILRKLLKLASQAQDDRQFVEDLRGKAPQTEEAAP
jgi:hypothetical protein